MNLQANYEHISLAPFLLDEKIFVLLNTYPLALYASATRTHKSVNMTKCALTSALVLVLRCVIVAVVVVVVGADFLIAGSLAHTHTHTLVAARRSASAARILNKKKKRNTELTRTLSRTHEYNKKHNTSYVHVCVILPIFF